PNPDQPIHSNASSTTQTTPSFANPTTFRGSYHRRAQSEVQFRIPDDLDLVSDPFEGLGSEDDLFCSYMDIEKLGGSSKGADEGGAAGSSSAGSGQNPKGGEETSGGSGMGEKSTGGGKGRHRYSNSVDGCSMMESIEAKKAMAPDKLAELWTVDPKRAKALNEALKKEVERLKIATGEMTTPTDTFNLGMHHIPYTQSSYFPPQPQHVQVDTHNIQMPQFHPFQSNMLTPNQSVVAASNSHAYADMMQQDPLGRLQGLDISSRGSRLVKSEGPSISAGEHGGTL
ncbi:Basic-leucine zipper transcription factor family protein isoform 3, partial [Theobroma cacao]